MRTSNPMQLKALIRARAVALGASPQLVLQDYLLERLLVRVSLSRWREAVILKGGMLVASLVGVEGRVTKDLDTTVVGVPLTHDTIGSMFGEICAIETDDDITFELVRTTDIREADAYPGIRVFVTARYGSMAVPLSIDVTTGDAITPCAVEHAHRLLFDEGSIPLKAYPPATCMAEKLETVITRGVATTRPRDYYDIVALWRTCREELAPEVLSSALLATATHRGSADQLRGYARIMGEVAADPSMRARWEAYARSYSYVGDLTLGEACAVVVRIMDTLGW